LALEQSAIFWRDSDNGSISEFDFFGSIKVKLFTIIGKNSTNDSEILTVMEEQAVVSVAIRSRVQKLSLLIRYISIRISTNPFL